MMRTFALVSSGIFAFAACAKEGTTNTNSEVSTTGAPLTNSVAASRITQARCAREERCNNIGAGKSYSDRAACEREVGQNTSSELKQSSCEAISQKNLDECIDDVTNQACNNPIDAIARVARCSRASLCK